MGKPKIPEAKLPTAAELGPLIELQAQTNRVGVETPFGSQNYRKNPDGTTTMVTDVGQEGRNLVGRAVGMGMTDSNRMQVPAQMNGLAGALMSRVGQRLGQNYGSQPVQLSQSPAMPAAKPQQQGPMPPTNLPGPR